MRRVVIVAVAALALLGAKPSKKKIDLKKPFAHETHLAQDALQGDRKLTCEDCHSVGTSKQAYCIEQKVVHPNHDQCTGCHATAFFTKPRLICKNCHTKTTFTSKPPLTKIGAVAPMRAVFNHKLHMDPAQRVHKRFDLDAYCSTCHEFVKGGESVETPSHPECCGCHTKEHVEPTITDCVGCHVRPTGTPRKALIKDFSHKNHRVDPVSGKSLECTRCHYEVVKATELAQVPTPAMPTCITCHDGKAAFAYAECLKCHGPEVHDQPLPESHKIAP